MTASAWTYVECINRHTFAYRADPNGDGLEVSYKGRVWHIGAVMLTHGAWCPNCGGDVSIDVDKQKVNEKLTAT